MAEEFEGKAGSYAFEYEVSMNEVRIRGQSVQVLLAGFLTRAKFGEAYRADTLLNHILADWLKALALPIPDRVPVGPRGSPPGRFGHEFIDGVATTIFHASPHLGWFRWSQAEQVAFLRDVVAVPNTLSDDDVGDIREAVEMKLRSARRVVDAADGTQS